MVEENLADKAAPSQEYKVWEGKTSQVFNLFHFILGGLLSLIFVVLGFWFSPYCLAGLVISFGYIFWKWLSLNCAVYTLTNERLIYSFGILNKVVDKLELYRIKDYTVYKPFFLRIFFLGNINIVSSDRTTPDFRIRGIAEPDNVCDSLRGCVEEQRRKLGARENDFDMV